MIGFLNTLTTFFWGVEEPRADTPTSQTSTAELMDNPWLSMLLEGEGITRSDLNKAVEDVRRAPRADSP